MKSQCTSSPSSKICGFTRWLLKSQLIAKLWFGYDSCFQKMRGKNANKQIKTHLIKRIVYKGAIKNPVKPFQKWKRKKTICIYTYIHTYIYICVCVLHTNIHTMISWFFPSLEFVDLPKLLLQGADPPPERFGVLRVHGHPAPNSGLKPHNAGAKYSFLAHQKLKLLGVDGQIRQILSTSGFVNKDLFDLCGIGTLEWRNNLTIYKYKQWRFRRATEYTCRIVRNTISLTQFGCALVEPQSGLTSYSIMPQIASPTQWQWAGLPLYLP